MPKRKTSRPSVSVKGENAVGVVNASGRARVSINQKSVRSGANPEMDGLFKHVNEQIKARPEDPNVDKKEIKAQVTQIQAEAAKGPKANPDKLERWMRTLGEMAPDILDVITATLVSPATGIATVLKKIAAKVKAEGGPA